MNKNIFTVFALMMIVIIGSFLIFGFRGSVSKNIAVTNFEECKSAGYPVTETIPPVCTTSDGKTFVAIPKLGTNGNTGTDISDLIQVNTIQMGDVINSPLVITGLAKGGFYFEGSFPVKLLDDSGKVLAQAPAQALSDWMSGEFVPFKATLTFKQPTQGGSGVLVFQNDNPSGLPENVIEFRIPIKFAPVPDNSNAKYDTNINMKVGDKITFPDTLVVELETIEDSRCKPNVQCFWAGELNPVLRVGKARSEVRLGATTKTSVTFGNYTFTLKSATATTANISVKKNNSLSGYLMGHVTVGPICPVEIVGQPCEVPEATYTGREALVYSNDKQTIKYRMNLDKNGDYKFTLPIGEYYVQIKPAGMRDGEMKYVKITTNTTSSVNFDIDTGIR